MTKDQAVSASGADSVFVQDQPDIAPVEMSPAEISPTKIFRDIPQETSAIIDYIQLNYHEKHRRELPELVQLARKIEQVHANHPNVPGGAAEILQKMLGEMEVHMRKEELILFPNMRRGAGAMLAVPIAQMRHEHEDHDRYLRRLEYLTNDFTLPSGACQSWRALYTGLSTFRNDLIEHIYIENNILFPRFDGTSIE